MSRPTPVRISVRRRELWFVRHSCQAMAVGRSLWIALGWLGCLVAAGPALGNQSAPAQIQEAGNEAKSRLAHVTELLSAEQWDEAVEALRRTMSGDPESLIAFPPSRVSQLGFERFTTLDAFGQLKLVQWQQVAPAALALYRTRVDGLAQRWLDEGRRDRDPEKLIGVVRRYFASSYGDDALYWLGEMQLETGNLVAARHCWERIHPALRTPDGQPIWLAFRQLNSEQAATVFRDYVQRATVTGQWLAYPDTDLPLADILARLVLASILERHAERAQVELRLLESSFPDARGQIGGREGLLVQLLGELLAASAEWPRLNQRGAWSTFARTSQRNAFVSTDVDVTAVPIWQAPLPLVTTQSDTGFRMPSRVADHADGLLSYFPAVWQGKVLVHQPQEVTAFDARSGAAAWTPSGNLKWPESSMPAISASSISGVPRYLVTVHNDRLVARVGAPATAVSLPEGAPTVQSDSYLIAVDLTNQKLFFRIETEEDGWYFDGCPVVDDARVYVCLRRRDQVSSQMRIAAYEGTTGRRIWQSDICRGENGDAPIEITQTLLTLNQGTLYCNTNLGVVAAVECLTGRITWLVRYPRAPVSHDPDISDRYRFRDLTPCLSYRDMIVVAPADCDRVFAVNAATGALVWTTAAQEGVDIVHLLGAEGNRLLASGDYLYWIDIDDGTFVGQFPSQQKRGAGFALPRPHGYGRGVIAGNTVFWPTLDRIYLMDRDSPSMVAQPIDLSAFGLTGGNLILDEDILLMATADRLVAFSAFSSPPIPSAGKSALSVIPRPFSTGSSASRRGVFQTQDPFLGREAENTSRFAAWPWSRSRAEPQSSQRSCPFNQP